MLIRHDVYNHVKTRYNIIHDSPVEVGSNELSTAVVRAVNRVDPVALGVLRAACITRHTVREWPSQRDSYAAIRAKSSQIVVVVVVVVVVGGGGVDVCACIMCVCCVCV